jgi:hypothetical protein
MRKFSVFFTALVILLTFSLAFTACDDDSTSSGKGIVGKWEGMYSSYKIILELFANSRFTYTIDYNMEDIPNTTMQGTYNLVDGDILELTFDNKPDEPERGYYDGNTINLGYGITLTKK